MKKKYLIIIIFLLVIVFGSGITYSAFHSQIPLNVTNQKIAKFIFNNEELNNINLDLRNLQPGDIKTYNFAIKNFNDSFKSDVTIKYQITIKTFHVIPLTIELYKNEELIINCDETFSRNDDGELVCNSAYQTMENTGNIVDNYKMLVKYDKDNSFSYEDSVDFIELSLESFQNS